VDVVGFDDGAAEEEEEEAVVDIPAADDVVVSALDSANNDDKGFRSRIKVSNRGGGGAITEPGVTSGAADPEVAGVVPIIRFVFDDPDDAERFRREVGETCFCAKAALAVASDERFKEFQDRERGTNRRFNEDEVSI
jgi:hypothetical protein